MAKSRQIQQLVDVQLPFVGRLIPWYLWLRTFCSRSGGRRDRYSGMKLSVNSLGGSEQRRAIPCSRSVLSPRQRQRVGMQCLQGKGILIQYTSSDSAGTAWGLHAACTVF